MVQRAINEAMPGKKPAKKPLSQCKINLSYLEQVLQTLFNMRNANDILSSRVRFKIQDLIDVYQQQWRQVIIDSQINAVQVDEDGCQYKYVPKDAIFEDKRSRGGSYIYVKKQSAKQSEDSNDKKHLMVGQDND